MKGEPRSVCPTSRMRAMCSLSMRAAARASFKKRPTSSGESVSSWDISLMATRRPSSSWVAAKTAPMAPRPIRRSMRYLPATRSPTSGSDDPPRAAMTVSRTESVCMRAALSFGMGVLHEATSMPQALPCSCMHLESGAGEWPRGSVALWNVDVVAKVQPRSLTASAKPHATSARRRALGAVRGRVARRRR